MTDILQNRITISLEEFKVLHSQILERAKIQQQLFLAGVTFGAGIITATVSFVVQKQLTDSDFLILSYFFLLIPIPFYAILIAYTHSDYMIAVTAGYIHSVLRPQINSLNVSTDLLQNEFWFEKSRKRNSSFFFGWGGIHLLLLSLPVFFFVGYLFLVFQKNSGINLFHWMFQSFLIATNIFYLVGTIHRSKFSDTKIKEIINDSNQ